MMTTAENMVKRALGEDAMGVDDPDEPLEPGAPEDALRDTGGGVSTSDGYTRPDVESMVALWKSGNGQAVALRVLDALDSYADFAELLFAIGHEDAVELCDLMDDLTADEKSPHAHDGDETPPPGEDDAQAEPEVPERDVSKFGRLRTEESKDSGVDKDKDGEKPTAKSRLDKLFARRPDLKKKMCKENEDAEPLSDVAQAWEDDKNGEYVQINDDGTAVYVSHGRAMETIYTPAQARRRQGLGGYNAEENDPFPAIQAWMEKKQFFPNIWSVNDHGNVTLLDKDGNDLGGLV